MAIKLSTTARNAMGDGITSSVGSAGKMRIYAGSRPADPQTAIGAQTLLAELICGTPFAPAASGGVLTANAITQANAVTGGTASFYRLFKSDGTTAVIDGDVGVSGTDLILNTVTIVSGGPVVVTSYTLTMPNA